MHESEYTRKYIIPQLERLPNSWWLKVVGTPAQRNGIPDIVGCYRGRFVAVEVKNPENDRTCTKLQRKNLREIRTASGLSLVVRDPDTMVQALRPGWAPVARAESPHLLAIEFPFFVGDEDPQDLEEL